MKFNYIKKATSIILTTLVLTGCSIEGKNNKQLYSDAFYDVKELKEENIRPLIILTKDDNKTVWKDDKVLMFFLTKENEIYENDELITQTDDSLLLYSVKEFSSWYMTRRMNSYDKALRLKQLLGRHFNDKEDHVVAAWINPNDLIRPAYITAVDHQMSLSFSTNETEEYKEWFTSNTTYSYINNELLWTRLGYSYDWSLRDGDKYGLSEFISFKGAALEIEKYLSISDFYYFSLNY